MRSARHRLFAATMAAVSIALSSAWSAAGTAAAVPAVSIVRSQKEAGDALGKGLPGAGGRLLIVSPHDYLSTLILPLHRAGYLKELVTVLPFDSVLTVGQVEGVHAFLQKAGVSPEDRKTFVLDNGSVAGSIEGMPVRLCTLTTLSRQDGRLLLALDTAFLPAVYRNEVKTPMIELAWKLVLTLQENRATGDNVVLFDAAGRSDFPLAFGYLKALLREMLGDPAAFAAGLPEKWRLLKDADSSYYFSQYDEAMTLYREYLGASQGDASACYKIAVMAARDLDPDMSLQWINKAVDADAVYKRVYAEIAGYLAGKDLFEGAERILLGGLAKFPRDPGLATGLAGLYLSRGETMRQAGNMEEAAQAYEAAAAVDGSEAAMRERARSLRNSLASPTPE